MRLLLLEEFIDNLIPILSRSVTIRWISCSCELNRRMVRFVCSSIGSIRHHQASKACTFPLKKMNLLYLFSLIEGPFTFGIMNWLAVACNLTWVLESSIHLFVVRFCAVKRIRAFLVGRPLQDGQ
jgi:hypothetical protein